MTAPDSRDSVERVVAEMREELSYSVHAVEVSVSAFRAWVDRLQALARGPQQAGGEDGVEVAPLYVELEIEAALGHAGRTSERLMRMAAEAKALLHRAETAEAALREAGRDAERYRWLRECGIEDERRVMIRSECGGGCELKSRDDLDAAIDAALNGGQDDA